MTSDVTSSTATQDQQAIDAAHQATLVAQKNLDAVESQPPPSSEGQPWSSQLVTTLSISTMVFTFLVLALATALLWKKDAYGHVTLKVFGLILIVSMSAMLLIVGYGKDQLTPIVGLFGAIAGYLLGKDAPAKEPSPPDKTTVGGT